MAQIQVVGVSIEVRTIDLTKSVFKQLPQAGFDELRQHLDGKGNLNEGVVLGWVHGSVLDRTEEWKKWLIVKLGECRYARFDAMDSTCKKYPQIIL